ncbi:MAG: hypothetical protein Q9219_004411 [cf. Caloplaca sp. 3 TL-2023]
MGAARIYSANRKRRKVHDDHDEEEEVTSVEESDPILGLQTSRSGHLIATVTADTMTIWQASPIVVLALAERSTSSVNSYGPNIAVLLKPDASIAAVQTANGFLVTYSVVIDPTARVYQQIRDGGRRRSSTGAFNQFLEQDRAGFPEVTIKFRMVIRIDAGIAAALALDNEVVVATKKPAAVQCIKWTPDSSGKQTSTELASRMAWMQKKSVVINMVYNRAMSLAVWITSDGNAYAVQRLPEPAAESEGSQRLFQGYGFHSPQDGGLEATRAAINARFSLLAVACAGGEIYIYAARDYVGSIPLSHKLVAPAPRSVSGEITCISFSPDGYCLVAGYEHGWAMWSVYGKPGASSFNADTRLSKTNDERWLMSVNDVCWINAGFGVLLTCVGDSRIWNLEMTKSAVTTCFTSANISRTLLLSSSDLLIYRGFDLPIKSTISADAPLWQHVALPISYVLNQQPIRSAVISSDGRYVAIAGKRGLAHYSINSGRWKMFDDAQAENAFVVRGGMCWYQHVLIAAVESDESYELRMYSREKGLTANSLLHVTQLPAAVVVMSITGQDSLLVYTFENILHHYIVYASNASVKLVPVGQLALHGIVRAPARKGDGDPSQDVAHASVLFLVDAKLVLLQSSTNEAGLKYDMRVLAPNVEYFDLMRDRGTLLNSSASPLPESPSDGSAPASGSHADHGLRDSLWYFDGDNIRCWLDVEDLLRSASTENDRELPQPVSIATDFYPTSVMLERGLVLGLDADLIQRRDVYFAFFRHTVRTQLFIPHILYRHLSHFDPAAASILVLRYQDLSYLSHALEVLLHMALDDEVDMKPGTHDSFMPHVVTFLSAFPDYLDIVVQCTRKTEVRSWRTLFGFLPPPQQLFEESLEKGLLKTAGGYLLVLQTFQEFETSSEQCIRLLQRAKEAGDWDLCKELARFLMAQDTSGDTLRGALSRMHIEVPGREDRPIGSRGQTTRARTVEDSGEHLANGSVSSPHIPVTHGSEKKSMETVSSSNGTTVSEDYFSTHD